MSSVILFVIVMTLNIQTEEMKYLRSVKTCNRRNYIKNEEIRSDLDIIAVNETIKEYRREWIQHINRKEESRISKMAKYYNVIINQ